MERLKCFFGFHKITDHKFYDWGGTYYCPICKSQIEYYQSEFGGIVERKIKRVK